jgi:CRISPR-associated protein Csm2
MNQTIGRSDIQKIIVEGDAVVLVNRSKAFGESLKQAGLTKSQIRNVFGTVRQIDAAWDQSPDKSLRRVLLLKPRLAYQSARERKAEPLAEVLSTAIDFVVQGKDAEEQRRRFSFFVDFFEAILAYHTAAGGR